MASISDCGIGYLNSLLEKTEKLKIYSEYELKAKNKHDHLKAIIEAVFRRFKQKTYGLSSVIRLINEVNGIVRVHSVNTQVAFTPYNNLADSHENIKKYGHQTEQKYINLLNTTKNIQSSPLKIRSSMLAGVHIEFEIPINFDFGGAYD